MNAVFADAGYWIALFNPRDQLHARAIAVSQSMEKMIGIASKSECYGG